MRYHRKTAPKVIAGDVQRQNRWRPAEHDYSQTHQIRVERYAAPPGYRHLLSPPDVSAILALLPDWREISLGLERVVLSADTSCFGWHRPGTVAVCAWPAAVAHVFSGQFYRDNAPFLRRIGVPCRPVVLPPDATCPHCPEWAWIGGHWSVCASCHGSLCDAYQDAPEDADDLCYLADFTESTAHAFLCVDILVHELGHHHDRMTSPGRRHATRGEPYAEAYARRFEDVIWPAYCRVFRPRGEPRRPKR
jgi:hypothetical protein